MRHLLAARCLLERDGVPVVRPARIDVSGSQIVGVLEGDLDASGLEGEVVDLGDLLVGPAWINAHTHLAMSALRGLGGVAGRRGNVVEDVWFALEAHLSPADVRSFARIGAMECLLSGAAVAWDHYYGGRAVGEALRDVGMAGVIAPTLQDRAGPGVPVMDAQLAATEDLATDADLAAAGIVAAVGPHATDTVGDGLWKEVTALAARLDLPIHVHVAQSFEEVERVEDTWGCSPIARLQAVGALEHRVLLVHGLLASDADRARLDPSRHTLGHCPFSQAQYAFPADLVGWRRAGFEVVVGTDAGACNDSMDVSAELRVMAAGPAWGITASSAARGLEHDNSARAAGRVRQLRGDVLTRHSALQDPGTLLRMITSAPGALHPRLRSGRVAVGHRADLAAWDPTHPALWPATDPLRALAFGSSSAALCALMVGGQWRIAPGGSPTDLLRRPDWIAWRREASERLEPLLSRWT